MLDAGLAIAIVIIIGFVIFIGWAKTVHGKSSLRNVFGEPQSAHRRRRVAKRSPSSSARKPTKRG